MKLRRFLLFDVRYFTFKHLDTLSYSASVDPETDNKIQRTIQTEFNDRTLLCIARVYTSYFVSSSVNAEFQIAYAPSSHTTVFS